MFLRNFYCFPKKRSKGKIFVFISLWEYQHSDSQFVTFPFIVNYKLTTNRFNWIIGSVVCTSLQRVTESLFKFYRYTPWILSLSEKTRLLARQI